MISRRKFVKFGALAAAGGYVIGLPGKLYGSVSGARSTGFVSAEHLVPFINSKFRFRHSEMKGSKVLRLLEVKNMKPKTAALGAKKCDSFSLFFQSEDAEKIEGKIYEISHERAGEMSLFVSPVTPNRNYYEAIISRV